MLGLNCWMWAFSSWDEQQILSSCSMRASHCGVVSCYGACGSIAAVAHGLSCPETAGILLNQGSNRCPLHCKAACLPQDHQESPIHFLYDSLHKPIPNSQAIPPPLPNPLGNHSLFCLWVCCCLINRWNKFPWSKPSNTFKKRIFISSWVSKCRQ